MVEVHAGVSCAFLKVQVTQRSVVGWGWGATVQYPFGLSVYSLMLPKELEFRFRHNTEVKSLDFGIQQLSYLLFS